MAAGDRRVMLEAIHPVSGRGAGVPAVGPDAAVETRSARPNLEYASAYRQAAISWRLIM
jgi:hypothetical protein